MATATAAVKKTRAAAAVRTSGTARTPTRPSSGPAAAVAVLEHLDPTTLTLNVNVRTAADLDPMFVESVREHGVLTPVCLASWEVALDDDAWRKADNRQTRNALVLQAIARWGHPLSAIEARVVAGTASTPADVDGTDGGPA